MVFGYHTEKKIILPLFSYIHKNQFQGHQKSEYERAIKLSEGNIGDNLHDLGVDKYFFKWYTKTIKGKTDRWDYIKIES